MSSKVKFLDLDALEDKDEFVIKINGEQHKLVPITVRNFVKNTKIVANLPQNMTVEEETTVIIEMLGRAFPTIPEDDLWEIPLDKLNTLLEFAQQNNGSNAVNEKAEAEAEANPPVAAS